MKRLAIPCMAPSWPFRLIFLLTLTLGFDAVGQETSKEPVALEKSRLKGYSDNGYALRKVIPIENLPPRITFKKGEISLVPDPLDRTGNPHYGYAKPYMVVFLINDTDEPIPGIIGELQKVRSQVKFGGNWFSREPLQEGCGSVAAPEDLPARNALALGGISDQRGDIDGEIRYIFTIPNRRIASESQRGRYMANELQVTMMDENFQYDLETSLGEGLLKNRWNDSMPATNPEEFCALLELIRHYQLSLRERARIMEWLLERAEKHDATQEQAKAIVRIKASLSKPWLIENDAQALADRCIAALEAKPSRVYGTPEKCRACVWRLLDYNWLNGGTRLSGHEFKPADNASILKLVALAKASLDSSDPGIADAAAGFLGSRKITEDMFATEELLRFLESDRTPRIGAGLSGLAARNRMHEAIPWLMDRMKKGDPKFINYYRRFRSSLRGEIEDWERTVLIHLFEADPLETLETISAYGVYSRVRKLPMECSGALRVFLNEQLSHERKQWWTDRAELDKRGQLAPDQEARGLSLPEGIHLLDALDDPVDVPLLKSFLDHPAANWIANHDGSRTLYFSARSMAKESLQRRKIAVPDSVVTRIEMKPPPPPRDRREDFMRYVLSHDLPIMGVSLAVLTGACFALRRMRSSMGSPLTD